MVEQKRCGLDWVNFWDEISTDRIVAWMKNANSGGVVGEIAAAAIKRSEEIAPSTTATLEQEDWTTWDGTMMGRIVEWMTGDIGRGFSITGGKVNRGKRENDVAISEVNNDRRWASMIAAGCRITGIHWISETLTDDDNTWVSELQNNGKFNNNGYFKWKHSTHDAKTAERKTLKKRTKWSEWTKHVKRITKQAIEEKEEENEQMEMAKSSDDSESAEEGENEDGEQSQQQRRTNLFSKLADEVSATSWITEANFRAERDRATGKAFASEKLNEYEVWLTTQTTTIHDYVRKVKSRVLLGGPVVRAPAPSQAEEDQFLKKFVTDSNARNAREAAEAAAASKAADAFAKAEAVKVKNTKKLIRDNEKECNRQQTAKSAATEKRERTRMEN